MIFAALISVVSTIFSVFTLSYAVNTIHIARPTMLTVLVLANVVALGGDPRSGGAGRPDRPQAGVHRRAHSAVPC